MAALPTPSAPVKFPAWARLALGVVIGVLGYLVAGELPVSEELRGAISAIVAFLASFGIVPPKPDDLPALSPEVRFGLTGAVTVAAYFLSIVNIDPTVRGVVTAVLAFAASVGIVPPQAIGRK